MNDFDITLQPTRDESDLFRLLEDVAAARAPGVVVRIAGGWVRDKILGLPSDDMDVMIDRMPGDEFAALVAPDPSCVHVFRENPDKSKHVRTAELRIKVPSGKEYVVQFAMARQEVYDGGSRIPSEVRMATPQEDAMRRDLTINSMFWNLRTRQVEDFTGTGLRDLLSKPIAIRTPLDPRKTFLDDPLRMLRMARFAARFCGAVDGVALGCMADPDDHSLLDALVGKVSRERIGDEFLKMAKQPNAEEAFRILFVSGILGRIIQESVRGTKYEGRLLDFGMDQKCPQHDKSLSHHTLVTVLHAAYGVADSDSRGVLALAALCHDFGKMFTGVHGAKDGRRTYYGHEDESAEMAALFLRWMQLDRLVPSVGVMCREHMRVHHLVGGSMQAIRRFVRQMSGQPAGWRDVLRLSKADSAATVAFPTQKDSDEAYDMLHEQMLLAEDQVRCRPGRPPAALLDGNEIMALLGVRPGPWMSDLTAFVACLRDEKPDMTKEEASGALVAAFGKLVKDGVLDCPHGTQRPPQPPPRPS